MNSAALDPRSYKHSDTPSFGALVKELFSATPLYLFLTTFFGKR